MALDDHNHKYSGQCVHTELHGHGDDGTTAVTTVMGLKFMTDNAVIAGMGKHSRYYRGSGDSAYGKAAVAVTECSVL